MAKGLKYSLGLRALKKITGTSEIQRRFRKFEEVTEVLMAWDEAQLETDKKAIDKFVAFMEKHGKHVVKVIYFHKRKKDKIPPAPDDDTLHFSKLDFNALGLPKTTQVKKLMAQPYHYFINLNLDGRLPLKSIAGFSNAECRIGFNKDKAQQFYDLMLGNPDKPVIENYIKDLEYYLQKIG